MLFVCFIKQGPGVSHSRLYEITTPISTIKRSITQPVYYNVCKAVLFSRKCGDFPDLALAPFRLLSFVLSVSSPTVGRRYS